MNKSETAVSMATYNRMPIYLKCLYNMKSEGRENVSSGALAEASGENASVVKKDLSFVITGEGKPKVGYCVCELIADIEEFLGCNNVKDAVLVGAGKLGQALLSFEGFDELGLNIIAGFDVDDKIIGTEINGKKILPTGKLDGAIEKLGIRLAILCVPHDCAQIMADALVKAGIRAIWNFTFVQLKVPESVAVKNENLASSLAVLSKQLGEILRKEAE